MNVFQPSLVQQHIQQLPKLYIESDIQFDDLISSIFKLYAGRIEQIVCAVKQSPNVGDNIEAVIVHALNDFRSKLEDICHYYVNDIWENYQTYSSYQQDSNKRHQTELAQPTILRNDAFKLSESLKKDNLKPNKLQDFAIPP